MLCISQTNLESNAVKLSPSSINLFKNNKALWVLKHYYKVRTPSGEAALRGKYVEDGLNHYLVNESYEDAIDIAHTEADVEQRLERSDYFDNALLAIQEFCDSEPEQQVYIECEIGGVDIHGYIDYEFEDKCVDLKTTNKLPVPLKSTPKLGQLPAAKMDNIRQQTIYHIATGKPQVLAYVSPTGYYIHNVQEAEFNRGLDSVKEIIESVKMIDGLGEQERLKYTAPFVERLYYHPFVPKEIYEQALEIWHGHI